MPMATHIGEYAFARCERLTSVEMPSAVVVDPSAFHGSAFRCPPRLPQVTGHKRVRKQLGRCSICLEPMETSACQFGCDHVMHDACFCKMWAAGHTDCPLCRAPIRKRIRISTLRPI